MNQLVYPLSALVGQEVMVEALLLLAVDPELGGLLLVGEKGTAKSTAARALAEILPPLKTRDCSYHCRLDQPQFWCQECLHNDRPAVFVKSPFRTIPLGVTEERLLGGLDWERTLREGRPILRPGLLGEANNGLVYIDEVNLFDPGLAHLMLDAVSGGQVILERDGFSLVHPTRVCLLGSMNPEEGSLGPQLTDRFALTVHLTGESDLSRRTEIVRRRLCYEQDPLLFREQYAKSSAELTRRIKESRARLSGLVISQSALDLAAEMAKTARVAGHRAELALIRVARAKAAWAEVKVEVGPEWVLAVEHLVIPERRRLKGPRTITQTVSTEVRLSDRPEENGEPAYVVSGPEIPLEYKPETLSPDDKTYLKIFNTAETFSIITPRGPKKEMGPRDKSGRRSYRETLKARGRAFRTTARRLGRPLSLSATLRAAAPHQISRRLSESDETKYLFLKPSDFREKVYRQKTGRLVIFVVDSSGSIGTLYRMEEAKAAAMSLLAEAYQKRDRVAIITFYGHTAELLLPPTNSPDLAGRLLTNLPSGGKTPLAAALALTHKLIRTERAKDPMINPYIILMTDGRPNIPLDPACAPWPEVLKMAGMMAQDPCLHFLLIDTDRGAYNDYKMTRELSERLRAPRLSLEDLRAGHLEKWLETL